MSQPGPAPTSQVFKPTLAALRTGPVGILVPIVLIVPLLTWRRVDAVTATAVLLIGLAMLAGFAVVLLRARLEVGPGVVALRRVFGSTRVESRSLDRIIFIAALVSPTLNNVVGSRVVGVDRSGERVFKLTSSLWSREAVVAAANALASGTKLVVIDQQATVGQVKLSEPAALSWTERHPGLTALLFFLAFVLFFVGAFGIFVLTDS